MSALITAALSYIGSHFLVTVLAKLGIGGARAATAATVGKEVAPVFLRILKRLHAEKEKHPPGSTEAQAAEEESGAMEALMGGWFK